MGEREEKEILPEVDLMTVAGAGHQADGWQGPSADSKLFPRPFPAQAGAQTSPEDRVHTVTPSRLGEPPGPRETLTALAWFSYSRFVYLPLTCLGA